MAVLLFSMTKAVMGCYQKEAEPIDIPDRMPSGTSAPQPLATPAGEVIPELTPCILHEFVEKIIVHAASDPKGEDRTQEIDIYHKGIGALEMSKVTASMEK